MVGTVDDWHWLAGLLNLFQESGPHYLAHVIEFIPSDGNTRAVSNWLLGERRRQVCTAKGVGPVRRLEPTQRFNMLINTF